jgi:menaquinone-specific isochorismate synthase
MKKAPPKSRLVSYTARCAGISVDQFLRSAQGNTRFYWQDGQETLAGFGTTAELIAWGNRFDSIAYQAHQLFDAAVIVGDNPAPRLFGGFAFSDDFVPDNTWAIYAPAYFVLPHYQLTQHGGETRLTLNILITPDENPQDILAEMEAALATRYEALCQYSASAKADSPTPTMIRYPMPYETWEHEIKQMIEQMADGELKKVVLARVCELQFAEPIDLDNTLAYLNEQYADCYRFLFEPRPHHAFYGATPELLARVEGQSVQTMGLAGSIRRGNSPEEDAELSEQIFRDPKERHEHALVVDAIRERLGQLTSTLDIPAEPQVYRLRNIQHLHTPITGQLKEARGVLPIVEALHPTPALGGSPREIALQLIRKAEPVPRGWYAAPIGWLDQNLDGAFGVAIRSAVTQDRRVWLYAGAGIVKNSVPQKEWDETALKFKPMLNALGIKDELTSHPLEINEDHHVRA